MAQLGGNSPGRRRNGAENMFPGRPADVKAKKGKIPQGVRGEGLGGGTGRKSGAPQKKWWQR